MALVVAVECACTLAPLVLAASALVMSGGGGGRGSVVFSHALGHSGSVRWPPRMQNV
jgi:hypothetical protein